jgi:hypothetical protein
MAWGTAETVHHADVKSSTSDLREVVAIIRMDVCG